MEVRRGRLTLTSPEDLRDRRHARGGKNLDSLNLALDGLDVMRNIGREARGLRAEQGANKADSSQREEHTHCDGYPSPQTYAPKQINKGRKDKRQQDGQGNWDQDVLSNVQRRHDDRAYRDGNQRPELGEDAAGTLGGGSSGRGSNVPSV